MNYSNGRAAVIGDRVVHIANGRIFAAGTLRSTEAEIDIGHLDVSPFNVHVSDCLHMDDVMNALKAAGLSK